jgi:hypothetical protein
LPRAFVVHRAEVVSDVGRAVDRLRHPDFDPAQTVILSDGESLMGQGSATARIVHYGPEDIVIHVVTDSPAYLVLTDAHYPGWKASVDGQPTEVFRADVLFRAIRLEPGTHQVSLHYRPATVRWGGWVSAITLLGVGSSAVVLLRRNQQQNL